MACWTIPIGRDFKLIWKSSTKSCICTASTYKLCPDVSLLSASGLLLWSLKHGPLSFSTWDRVWQAGCYVGALPVATCLGAGRNPRDHGHTVQELQARREREGWNTGSHHLSSTYYVSGKVLSSLPAVTHFILTSIFHGSIIAGLQMGKVRPGIFNLSGSQFPETSTFVKQSGPPG